MNTNGDMISFIDTNTAHIPNELKQYTFMFQKYCSEPVMH
jgi:hypothetical protein